MTSRKHVVVTGVSTGIGYETAKKLMKIGFFVFGSVRSKEQADRLSNELGEFFEPIIFDVTDSAAIAAAGEVVQSRLGDEKLYGLVNNAGIAIHGPLMNIPLEQLQHQLDVNIIGVIRVTQTFLPLMIKPLVKSGGRIVNISSVSGRIAYPFVGPYAMSKHALEAFSDSLRRELIPYGIDVIVLQPGSTRTPIWKKAENMNNEFYETSFYSQSLKPLKAEIAKRKHHSMEVTVVTNKIADALTVSSPKTRYTLPGSWLAGWWLPRLLPARWVDKIISRRFGLNQKI